MKKILAVILALVMMLSLFACAKPEGTTNDQSTKPEETQTASDPGTEQTEETDGSTDAEPVGGASANTTGVADMTGVDANGKHLAFMVGVSASPWCLAVRAGAQAACDDYGVEMTVYEAPNDVGEEISVIENVINGAFDGLVIYPVDGDAEAPFLEQMNAAGRPTIGVAGFSNALSGQISLDQYHYGEVIGEMAASWINEKLGGKANIVLMSEDKMEQSILRGDGIQDTLEKLCPDATVVTREACFSTEDGLNSMETLLTQRSDINVVVCCNDTIGLGAYQALVNEGYTGRDDVAVFSADFTDDVVKLIKEGDIYRGSVDIEPYWSGYAAVELLLSQLTNGIPEETVIIPGKMSYTPQEELMQ